MKDILEIVTEKQKFEDFLNADEFNSLVKAIKAGDTASQFKIAKELVEKHEPSGRVFTEDLGIGRAKFCESMHDAKMLYLEDLLDDAEDGELDLSDVGYATAQLVSRDGSKTYYSITRPGGNMHTWVDGVGFDDLVDDVYFYEEKDAGVYIEDTGGTQFYVNLPLGDSSQSQDLVGKYAEQLSMREFAMLVKSMGRSEEETFEAMLSFANNENDMCYSDLDAAEAFREVFDSEEARKIVAVVNV